METAAELVVADVAAVVAAEQASIVIWCEESEDDERRTEVWLDYLKGDADG